MTVCGSFLRIALRASWFLVGALVYLTAGLTAWLLICTGIRSIFHDRGSVFLSAL